jgi:hypothetical protein
VSRTLPFSRAGRGGPRAGTPSGPGAACADPELLSAYLDGELPPARERAVEAHLADCPGCRAELDGLRSVVKRLRHLERAAPPQVLGQAVARRVALEARPRGLVARLEAALRRLPLDPATLVTFGVVVALAAILAVFVAGLQESDRRPVSAADPETGAAGLEVVTVVIGGRTFDRDGALWVERGAGSPQVTLAAGSPEAEAILDSEPRLRLLLPGADALVLRAPDGTTVRIETSD